MLNVIGSDIAITNTEFALNNAKGGEYHHGGGFKMKNSNATISNTKVISNTADGAGGGIYIDKCNVTIVNTKVISNKAHNSGGGFYVKSSNTKIVNTKHSWLVWWWHRYVQQ